MKNIILQHFDGNMRELDKLSSENISAYANYIGVEYKLITGKPFRAHLTAPCQKIHILDKIWNEYDNVAMLDIDMFTVKGLEENIFDVPGIGIHRIGDSILRNKICALGRANEKSVYVSGSLYKLSREQRQLLRCSFPDNDNWMDYYNKRGRFEDEGIMCELSTMAGIAQSYMPEGWSHCSHRLDYTDAKIVHVRPRYPDPKNLDKMLRRDKILNYQELVRKGIV